MFDQSIPEKRTWPVFVSLFTQTILISFAAVSPLVYTDQLPGLTKWAQKLVSPPPPAPLPIRETPAPARRAPSVFTAPPGIPSHVANLRQDSIEQPIEVPQAGVVGVGPTGIGDVIVQMLTSAVPVPKPPEPAAPVKTPTAIRGPVRVSGGIQEAKLIRRIVPAYPPLAIATRTQGTVHLVGVIAKDGTIRDLQVIDGHPLLVRAAMDAVRQWVYKPTLLSGEPVEVIAPIAVTFILGR